MRNGRRSSSEQIENNGHGEMMIISKLTLSFVLLICMCVTGCKSKTIEEAFHKTHKQVGQEILYQGEVEKRPFIIYKAPFDNGNIGAGIAIFEGNSTKGWKLSSSNSMYEESNLLIDSTGINFDDGTRKIMLYGFINDPAVSKIEITDKFNSIVTATIHDIDWKRIWYALVEINELKLKVYNNNEVITEVPY